MTKKKNNTANSRALNDPKVRKAMKSLQTYWDVLSPPEQIERVNDLLKSGCSLQGIAEETKIPLSTLRRHSVPKPPKPRKAEEKEMAKEEQKPFIAQQRVIPAADSVTETSPKGEETSEKGSHSHQDQPKSGQRELFETAPASIAERRQKLATITDQIKPRPIYTARSMKRQGK